MTPAITRSENGGDWLGELEAFRKKYGRKLDPERIDLLLHERFGDALNGH